jgi:hypothetical protein
MKLLFIISFAQIIVHYKFLPKLFSIISFAQIIIQHKILQNYRLL